MTAAQKGEVRRLLTELEIGELTHGDCVGADADAHAIALDLGVRVRIRPSNKDDLRARCVGGEVVAAPAEPLKRNRQIVGDGDLLVATPGMMKEQLRSGVWATIRYAIKQGREASIIWPDGRVETR